MTGDEELHRAIGRLEGKLDAVITTQEQHGDALTNINERVTANEVQGARNGAVAGGLITGFFLLLKETVLKTH